MKRGQTPQQWMTAVTFSPSLNHHAARVCIALALSGMKPNGVVSVPRSRLARDLHCHESRITAGITSALDAGYLTRLGKGAPGKTATYQALIPRGALTAPVEQAEGCGEADTKGATTAPLKDTEEDPEGCAQQSTNTRARPKTRPASRTEPQRDSRSEDLTEKQQMPETDMTESQPTSSAEDGDHNDKCRVCSAYVGDLRRAYGNVTCATHYREERAA